MSELTSGIFDPRTNPYLRTLTSGFAPSETGRPINLGTPGSNVPALRPTQYIVPKVNNAVQGNMNRSFTMGQGSAITPNIRPSTTVGVTPNLPATVERGFTTGAQSPLQTPKVPPNAPSRVINTTAHNVTPQIGYTPKPVTEIAPKLSKGARVGNALKNNWKGGVGSALVINELSNLANIHAKEIENTGQPMGRQNIEMRDMSTTNKPWALSTSIQDNRRPQDIQGISTLSHHSINPLTGNRYEQRIPNKQMPTALPENQLVAEPEIKRTELPDVKNTPYINKPIETKETVYQPEKTVSALPEYDKAVYDPRQENAVRGLYNDMRSSYNTAANDIKARRDAAMDVASSAHGIGALTVGRAAINADNQLQENRQKQGDNALHTMTPLSTAIKEGNDSVNALEKAKLEEVSGVRKELISALNDPMFQDKKDLTKSQIELHKAQVEKEKEYASYLKNKALNDTPTNRLKYLEMKNQAPNAEYNAAKLRLDGIANMLKNAGLTPKQKESFMKEYQTELDLISTNRKSYGTKGNSSAIDYSKFSGYDPSDDDIMK